jgi:hypothetical protein
MTDKSKTMIINEQQGKSRDSQMAELALSGVINSTAIVVDYSKGALGELNFAECIATLTMKTTDVNKGNLQEAERLLTAQAYALDAIFGSLARRAQSNMGEYINAADRYMRLALKAQGQCRATLETLATIKNPPIVVARQANITNGPQQVNNTINTATDKTIESSTRTHAHTENSNSVQNELLEERHDERVDTGTARTAGRGHPALATVGAGDRPAHS